MVVREVLYQFYDFDNPGGSKYNELNVIMLNDSTLQNEDPADETVKMKSFKGNRNLVNPKA